MTLYVSRCKDFDNAFYMNDIGNGHMTLRRANQLATIDGSPGPLLITGRKLVQYDGRACSDDYDAS